MARLALEHGPILSVLPDRGPLVGRRVIYLIGPEANRFALLTHGDRLGHEFGWTPVFGKAIGKGLINMDPPEQVHFRSVMHPAFVPSMIDGYLPIMQRVVEERTADWRRRGEVDLLRESREITFDIAAAALLGMETGAEVDLLRERFYALVRGPAPNSANGHGGRAGRSDLDAELRSLIASRRLAARSHPPSNVLDLLIRGGDERGRELSDDQLLGHIDILVLAGHETTTNLAAWVLHLLTVNQGWGDRVDAELDARFDGADAPMTGEIARRLPVLTNAVREAGRLQPPVMFLPRVALADFDFGGCVVQAGSPVFVAIAAGHRLPTVFDAPDGFDPGRLAPPRDEQRRHPSALATFGGGARTCLGLGFALMEIKTLVAYVRRRYHLEPVSRHGVAQIDSVVQCLPAGIRVRVKTKGACG